ncbi:hypothetical protein HMN09_00001200 [Mycena chlorophos]|uniref:Uncharacterized protein n=1 Tax=Mycena chlorophos TaxID=658473 RepID=A0A8H6TT10_MYCCL|nr:hypothetical protein HMN09_00001200 [Mycena chlorophos]
MAHACCPRCSAQIPAAQLSKGVRNPANKGYWYQRCPRCTWFQWLAFRPDESPGSSDNVQPDFDDPNSSSPPIPPTPFPLDPALYYESLADLPPPNAICAAPAACGHHDTHLHRAIPPILQQEHPHCASPSVLPPHPCPRPYQHCPPLPRSAILASRRNHLAKTTADASLGRKSAGARCAPTVARRRQAACMPDIASRHLLPPPTAILLRSHAHRPLPRRLPRLPRNFAVDGPSNDNTLDDELPDAPSTDPPPKIHRRQMGKDWQMQYKAGVEQQQRRQREQDEKRVQAQRAQTQVSICYYSEEDEDPQLIQEQGLPHLPQFNPSLHPRLLQKLNLAIEDEVWIYDYASRLWSRRDVNTTLMIVSGQTLIFRRIGLPSSQCPRLDQMITLYAPVANTGKSLKRKAEPRLDISAAQARTQSTPRPHRARLDISTAIAHALRNVIPDFTFDVTHTDDASLDSANHKPHPLPVASRQ